MSLIIFFSYSRQDNEIFHVPRIAQELKKYPEVKEILFYEGVDYANIVNYMNRSIGKCNIFLLFCSQNALNSTYIEDEWQAAYSKKKIIIPIFQDFDHVPPLLTSRLGVHFQVDNIKQSIIDIYNTIIKAYKTPKKAMEEVLQSRKFEILARFKLNWSQYFNEELLNQIGFKNYEDIKNFLKNPNQWEDVIKSISKFDIGNEWFENAFFSIRTGSKGLFHARYLDHALISVPPPSDLLELIINILNSNYILGLEAPAGWGKSRLILWIALSFFLQNKKVYYFPDPLELEGEIYRNSINALLKETNRVIIVDDFHLRSNSNEELTFWRSCFHFAKKNHNQILFASTKLQTSEEQSFTPYNFQIISSSEYTQYWKPQWVERFEIWFEILNRVIFKKAKTFYVERLFFAKKAKSPWGFVSLLVDLRDLIRKQLSITLNPNLVIIFTVLIWGFVVSRERGISPKEFYNSLRWIKNNSMKDWNLIETTGGNLWNYINNNDKEQFIEAFIHQVESWRKSPRDLTDIRLLPSEGVELGPNVPIVTHHVGWWRYSLKDMWENEWESLLRLKKLCELIILHSSPIIDGIWTSIEDSCKILESCSQIEVLYLDRIEISDISSLTSLTNLQELYLSNTQISDIRPLSSLTNLRHLSLSKTFIYNIHPLVSLTSLQYLDISQTQVSDISPLASLTNLHYLNLNLTEVSDISHLASLTNLRDLKLMGTKLSDISPLESLNELQELVLTDTKISDINILASLNNLQALSLARTFLSDITILKSLPKLQDLSLAEINLSGGAEKTYKETLEIYNKLLDKNPSQFFPEIALTQSKLGLYYYNSGRFEDAERLFREALDKFKKLENKNSIFYSRYVAMVQTYLCTTYQELGRLVEAEKLFSELLEIMDNNSGSWGQFGNYFYTLKMYDKALEFYDKALEIDINDSNVLYNKACIESLRDNKIKSIKLLKRAIELDKNYIELAKKDEDFKNIRGSKEFEELVGK